MGWRANGQKEGLPRGISRDGLAMRQFDRPERGGVLVGDE